MVVRPARPAELLGIDVRSLAAFRIGAALVVLCDLWFRSRELTAYFTDQGVLPRTARIELYDQLGQAFGFDHQWSLHMLSGHFYAQLAMFLVAAVFACGLLIGYRTRLCLLATWILLLSLDNRNPMILNSGDVLLRCLLFWSLFLPLGAAWSVDASQKPEHASPPRTQHYVSFASLAILLQLSFMYFFSVLEKDDPVWTQEFSGVYYALNCDAYATRLGLVVRQFPQVMQWLTIGAYGLELVGPLVVFSPLFLPQIRLATVASFWALHLGLAATMTIGLFPVICMVGWLLFLPTQFWEVGFVRRVIARCAALSGMLAEWLPGPRSAPQRRMPNGIRRLNRMVFAAIPAVVLLYVFLWNVRELDVSYWKDRVLPLELNAPARALGLDQNWSMFAPIPRTQDGWVVAKGTLRNGDEVNLWTPGATLPYEKPELVSREYKTQRWRKYLDNLTVESYGLHRLYFANWLQERWNREQAKGDSQREVVEVQLIHQIEETPPPGRPIPEPESKILWTWYYE